MDLTNRCAWGFRFGLWLDDPTVPNACASPVVFGNLILGPHDFGVIATDPAGNVQVTTTLGRAGVGADPISTPNIVVPTEVPRY